jgi:hypothetical protein
MSERKGIKWQCRWAWHERKTRFETSSDLLFDGPLVQGSDPMPAAKPPSPAVPPAPVTPEERDFIKATVRRFFGESAIVRNYGPDPKQLLLHVETEKADGAERYDCLGILMTRIVRDQISLDVTRRGTRIFGGARVAYRQGTIL